MRTGTAVLVRVTQGCRWLPLAQRIARRHLCATSCAMAKSIALNRAIERASCCGLCRPIANKLKLRSTPLFNSKADPYAVGVGIRLLLATLIGLADQEKGVFFLTDFSDQSFGIRSPTRSCLFLGSVTGAPIPIPTA